MQYLNYPQTDFKNYNYITASTKKSLYEMWNQGFLSSLETIEFISLIFNDQFLKHYVKNYPVFNSMSRFGLCGYITTHFSEYIVHYLHKNGLNNSFFIFRCYVSSINDNHTMLLINNVLFDFSINSYFLDFFPCMSFKKEDSSPLFKDIDSWNQDHYDKYFKSIEKINLKKYISDF